MGSVSFDPKNLLGENDQLTDEAKAFLDGVLAGDVTGAYFFAVDLIKFIREKGLAENKISKSLRQALQEYTKNSLTAEAFLSAMPVPFVFTTLAASLRTMSSSASDDREKGGLELFKVVEYLSLSCLENNNVVPEKAVNLWHFARQVQIATMKD